MRVLVVEPEQRPEEREIEDSLNAMQGIVGGYIQAIYPFKEPVALVCNEKGQLMDFPPNRGLRDEHGQIYDIVFGTFFLCGAPENDHLVSLTPEQIKRYQERFYTPEMFWGMDGRIVCLPLEVD